LKIVARSRSGYGPPVTATYLSMAPFENEEVSCQGCGLFSRVVVEAVDRGRGCVRGVRRALLAALGERLAATVGDPNTHPRDLAPLSSSCRTSLGRLWRSMLRRVWMIR